MKKPTTMKFNYWQLHMTAYNKKWLPTTRREDSCSLTPKTQLWFTNGTTLIDQTCIRKILIFTCYIDGLYSESTRVGLTRNKAHPRIRTIIDGQSQRLSCIYVCTLCTIKPIPVYFLRCISLLKNETFCTNIEREK